MDLAQDLPSRGLVVDDHHRAGVHPGHLALAAPVVRDFVLCRRARFLPTIAVMANLQTTADGNLQDAVLEELRRVPDVDRTTTGVAHGVLTLNGQAHRQFQRDAAEHAVEDLRGVRAVRNLTTLEFGPVRSDRARRIYEAFVRSADLDAPGEFTAGVSGVLGELLVTV